jgi:phytoene synthase
MLIFFMEANMAKVYPQTWERSLLPLAYEAEHLDVALIHPPVSDRALLERAYAYCNAITSTNSRTFYMATSLLPLDNQRSMRALYAFCRLSDDIIDCAEGDAEESLAVWRRKALAPAPPPGDLVAVAWADTRFRYQVPQRYAEQLIDGVKRDLYQRCYRTFEDMVRYAYGVASTVGLMCMHIIGFAGEYAIPYAIKLGVALQITNILRDVGEDWRCGRVYLPMDELEAFGLSEADLDRGQVYDRWRAFLRFQIERNRRLYDEANPGIALLNKDGRFAVAAASELYRAILGDIEAHDYDVFNRRAHVNAWGKVRKLPRIWWRNR